MRKLTVTIDSASVTTIHQTTGTGTEYDIYIHGDEHIQLIHDLIGLLPGKQQVRLFGRHAPTATEPFSRTLPTADYPTDEDRAQAAKRLQEIIGNRRSFPQETYVDDVQPVGLRIEEAPSDRTADYSDEGFL